MPRIHKYTKFEIEILALKNWLRAMCAASEKHFNPDKELIHFLTNYRPTVNWNLLDTNYYRHSQSMKIIYLLEEGYTYQQIQETLNVSPSTISKTAKGYGFTPSDIPERPFYEGFTAEWEELKKFIPKEIFIKWMS